MGKKIQKEDPNHHMGKTSGYRLIDGVYHIAPTYKEVLMLCSDIEQFAALSHRSVTGFASDTLMQLSIQQQKVWDMLMDDLGLDKNKKWLFYPQTGTIVERDKE